jgi:hypothetical protein
MKRIVLLTALAAMMAAAMALCGVAQAKPITNGKADAKCLVEAVRTLQPGFKPSDYAFHGGTEGDDISLQATDGADVFCGFGGNDRTGTLAAGDIFIGGEGDDLVFINEGTFYGQEGIDIVSANYGTYYGGPGNDFATVNYGTFNGGEGDDFVNRNVGTFNGGEGNDTVSRNEGTFVQ